MNPSDITPTDRIRLAEELKRAMHRFLLQAPSAAEFADLAGQGYVIRSGSSRVIGPYYPPEAGVVVKVEWLVALTPNGAAQNLTPEELERLADGLESLVDDRRQREREG